MIQLTQLQNFKNLYSEMKNVWKSGGFKGLYKKYGLKLFIVFFIYYLIRDLVIYIWIPWFIAQKALN
jgi:hypothetical protein